MSDTSNTSGVIDMSNVDLSQFPALNLAGSVEHNIQQPVTARYKPLPDITAYELALVLPGLLGKPIYEAEWAVLGSATRHFERLDQPTSDEPTVTA